MNLNIVKYRDKKNIFHKDFWYLGVNHVGIYDRLFTFNDLYNVSRNEKIKQYMKLFNISQEETITLMERFKVGHFKDPPYFQMSKTGIFNQLEAPGYDKEWLWNKRFGGYDKVNYGTFNIGGVNYGNVNYGGINNVNVIDDGNINVNSDESDNSSLMGAQTFKTNKTNKTIPQFGGTYHDSNMSSFSSSNMSSYSNPNKPFIEENSESDVPDIPNVKNPSIKEDVVSIKQSDKVDNEEIASTHSSDKVDNEEIASTHSSEEIVSVSTSHNNNQPTGTVEFELPEVPTHTLPENEKHESEQEDDDIDINNNEDEKKDIEDPIPTPGDPGDKDPKKKPDPKDLKTLKDKAKYIFGDNAQNIIIGNNNTIIVKDDGKLNKQVQEKVTEQQQTLLRMIGNKLPNGKDIISFFSGIYIVGYLLQAIVSNSGVKSFLDNAEFFGKDTRFKFQSTLDIINRLSILITNPSENPDENMERAEVLVDNFGAWLNNNHYYRKVINGSYDYVGNMDADLDQFVKVSSNPTMEGVRIMRNENGGFRFVYDHIINAFGSGLNYMTGTAIFGAGSVAPSVIRRISVNIPNYGAFRNFYDSFNNPPPPPPAPNDDQPIPQPQQQIQDVVQPVEPDLIEPDLIEPEPDLIEPEREPEPEPEPEPEREPEREPEPEPENNADDNNESDHPSDDGIIDDMKKEEEDTNKPPNEEINDDLNDDFENKIKQIENPEPEDYFTDIAEDWNNFPENYYDNILGLPTMTEAHYEFNQLTFDQNNQLDTGNLATSIPSIPTQSGTTSSLLVLGAVTTMITGMNNIGGITGILDMGLNMDLYRQDTDVENIDVADVDTNIGSIQNRLSRMSQVDVENLMTQIDEEAEANIDKVIAEIPKLSEEKRILLAKYIEAKSRGEISERLIGFEKDIQAWGKAWSSVLSEKGWIKLAEKFGTSINAKDKIKYAVDRISDKLTDTYKNVKQSINDAIELANDQIEDNFNNEQVIESTIEKDFYHQYKDDINKRVVRDLKDKTSERIHYLKKIPLTQEQLELVKEYAQKRYEQLRGEFNDPEYIRVLETRLHDRGLNEFLVEPFDTKFADYLFNDAMYHFDRMNDASNESREKIFLYISQRVKAHLKGFYKNIWQKKNSFYNIKNGT